MATQVFNNVTPEMFAAIAAEVQKQSGIVVQNNQGKASKLGVTIRWDFDPDKLVLVLDSSKSMFVPVSMDTITTNLTNLVSQARVGTTKA